MKEVFLLDKKEIVDLLSKKINGDLKVYYHPIEVKIGHNFSPVINKGKNQLDNTYNLLK